MCYFLLRRFYRWKIEWKREKSFATQAAGKRNEEEEKQIACIKAPIEKWYDDQGIFREYGDNWQCGIYTRNIMALEMNALPSLEAPNWKSEKGVE